MPATFNEALTTTKDVIRFALGDVATPFDLTDELIEGVLAKAVLVAGTDQDEVDNAPVTAAVYLANLLATIYIKKAAEVLQGSVRRMYRNRSEHFLNLARRIAAQGLIFTTPVTTLTTGLPVDVLDLPELLDAKYF